MQRKVFRIEETFAGRRADVPANARYATAERELSIARDIVAAHKHELATLIGEGHERRMVRAAGELGAVLEGMDKAAQTVLASAERIDDNARTLAAALKTDSERALAQSIRDQVARIYEACDFHDLAGQRIGKVIALLSTLEERLGAMLARCDGSEVPPVAAKPAPNRGLINGPKLDGDSGHASQHDIDKMFG